ncbi:ABC transporter permease [Roseisolibacter sp. H3M3-2]|uniref:ABC transporter permease n=1 Tax=Roseisolibacter sp. H3M3-2 TaxID=3031323 RepID=UPI0023DAA728|nr:ABC transporter permease [Roseisolibacter sp. H3M3-2]MDF1502411.1 ABC transporter permease [Roseisolibacter sp. H3M3-2]
MRWIHAARARLRLLFARRAAEARMDEEFRFHLDMEAERLARAEGLAPAEARRRAVVAFGLAERHRDAMRDGRGLAWLDRLGGLALDLRLGGRMLVKYPGLTIVGGLAMAFAIWVGAVLFEMVMLFVSPTLPLPQGDRIVHLRNWDVQANRAESRALHDLVAWRQAMRSVTDLGAWQDVARNLRGSDGEPRPVRIAAITASGFRVAATPPLLGRAIVPADEDLGAPPVVVLGHDAWRARFGADSAIVGRTVQLGDAYATVVGVMPDGFRFPFAHDAWTPFRPTARDDAPRRGPGITMFGRLAPGATLDDARAELARLGQRAATELPDTHRHLRPQVMPYAQLFGGGSSMAETLGIMGLLQAFVLMLLVLVCGNVALLMFARAATREGEIVVRSALGASRRRIVAQLFAEALVLGGVAAAVGLAAARAALRQVGLPFLEATYRNVPFWIDPRLSPATVLYACALTVLAAAITGVMPGLKITRDLGSRLRGGTAGGGTARFGGVWTAVIVAQVAVTVAFPAITLLEVRELRRIQTYDVGFAADRYLTVQLRREAVPEAGADGDTLIAADRARFGTLAEALRQRVAAEPGVVGVTFADRLPRTKRGDHRVFLDDSTSIAAAGVRLGRDAYRYTKIARVDPSYFDVLGAPILAGRGFQPADLAPGARVAIVDQGFVDQVLLGRDPIGRQLRINLGTTPIAGAQVDSLPFYQIVGLVKDLGMDEAEEPDPGIGLYLPAAAGSAFTPHMLVHTRGDPMAFASRVRAIAGALDPTLELSEFQRMDRVADDLVWTWEMFMRATLVMTGVALLLSLSGIYAVLSFTVARRTREIGVRVALGANRRTVIAAVFRRPLTQVGIGIAVGAALIYLGADVLSRTEFRNAPIALSPGQVALLVVYAAFMLGVCLLACVVPTRRALGIQPTEALRDQS